MSNSTVPPNAAASRATLKLKVAPRKPANDNKAPALPHPQTKATLKPNARWSDEYKQSMQAEMDALVSR